MKNQIIPLKDKNRKVFGFNEEQIIFSSKRHKAFDALMDSANKSGLLESIKTISLNSVKELSFNEKDETFTIKYDKNGKIKKDHVSLEDKSLRKSIVSELAEMINLNMDVSSESKIKPLLQNLFFVVLIPLGTWLAWGMAKDAENGEHFVATGRRSGLKQLVGNGIEAIGPMGVLIIGALGLLYMLYLTYKRFNNPASEIVYK